MELYIDRVRSGLANIETNLLVASQYAQQNQNREVSRIVRTLQSVYSALREPGRDTVRDPRDTRGVYAPGEHYVYRDSYVVLKIGQHLRFLDKTVCRAPDFTERDWRRMKVDPMPTSGVPPNVTAVVKCLNARMLEFEAFIKVFTEVLDHTMELVWLKRVNTTIALETLLDDLLNLLFFINSHLYPLERLMVWASWFYEQEMVAIEDGQLMAT